MEESEGSKWQLHYRVFRGTWASWDELFRQAAEFSNEIGPERVFNISHSEDKNDGVVAVWYWQDENSENNMPVQRKSRYKK